jgi:methylthioribose-1-phosphate isomerase
MEWRDGALFLLDQTRLPLETVQIECRDYETVCDSIQRLAVRGAPAIGLAAAYGAALAAFSAWKRTGSRLQFNRDLETAVSALAATRPTAVNLFWALDRVRAVIECNRGAGRRETAEAILAEAEAMLLEDAQTNRRMGFHGAALLPDGAKVLTHCNAGALATGAFGTALGVIFAAWELGKQIHVWVDETRPLLQGARLTAWELEQAGIPYTLITDNMAGHFMARGEIDLAMTGADRVAANGDAANKIGTYSVATLAAAHNLPFYIVAPTSTVDLNTPDGASIPIEERAPGEVGGFRHERVAPIGARVANPAFDVTPARLIRAIVTEHGVIEAPFEEGLRYAVSVGGHGPAAAVGLEPEYANDRRSRCAPSPVEP